MTESQSKRTRLKVWKEILVASGGTPHYNDTLYRTVRRTAEAVGVSYQDSSQPALRLVIFDIAGALGGINPPGFNDTIYQLERKIMVLSDTVIPCCNLPPLQAIGSASGIPPIEPPRYLLDEAGNPILDENGNPILLE